MYNIIINESLNPIINESLNPIINNILNINDADCVQCIHVNNGIIHHDGHLMYDNNHYCFNKWYHKTNNPNNLSYDYENENILSLVQIWNNFFQHITFDTLPKIPIIKKLMKNETFKILCMNNTQKELIKQFLKINDNVFIIQKDYTSYVTKNCYYINFFNSNNEKICMGSCGRNIISHFLLSPKNEPNTIVYISRGKNPNRNIVNENELIRFLSIFSKENNLIFNLFINPDGLSNKLRDSLSNCKILISPHGGAMGNMIYCNKKTNIVEIISYDKLNERPCFYYLSNALGLKYNICDPDYFDFNGNIIVNIKSFINIISSL
jgi:capsular polysaccharide biosynthesis protein